MPASSGLPKPSPAFLDILSHTFAFEMGQAKIVLSAWIVLIGGLSHPSDAFTNIFRRAKSVQMCEREVTLRPGIPDLCPLLVEGECLTPTTLYSLSQVVHECEIEDGTRVASARGSRVPVPRRAQVSLHAQPMNQRVADEILPVGVARFRSAQEEWKSLSVVFPASYPIKQDSSKFS